MTNTESREDLNARATELGVVDADKLPNMDAVRAAITEAEGSEPEESEEDKIARLAEDYEKNGTIAPGYSYRYRTSGGETHVVVTPIRKKG